MSTTVLATGSTFWYSSTVNQSPLVTAGFLAKQKRLLTPRQFSQEHENSLSDAADSLVRTEDVAACVSDWTEDEVGEPGVRYTYRIDLGLTHDVTSIVIGSAADGLVLVNRILVLDGTRERPVQLTEVEKTIVDLAELFPPAEIGVEVWQGAQLAERLRAHGLHVTLITPSARSMSEQWSTLARLVSEHRIALPPHARLRAELAGLTYDLAPYGIKVSGSPHPDVAVSVAMLAQALHVPRHAVRWL